MFVHLILDFASHLRFMFLEIRPRRAFHQWPHFNSEASELFS